jgi:hypothetical protein
MRTDRPKRSVAVVVARPAWSTCWKLDIVASAAN